MNKRRIIILLIIVLALLSGGLYFYFQLVRVNYLIPGVPYNGIYNLFFQGANTSEISSILDILGYWGDKKFSVSNLRQNFSPARLATSTPISLTRQKSEIQNFFIENGYETSGWLSVVSDDVIKEIKQFVNPKKKIPVIIFARRPLDPENSIFLFTPQVVIGVFDSSQKVIVHDHFYGNNYEISYGDFRKTQLAAGGMLAIWPSDKIKGSIEGPNYNLVYPQRLESMNKAGALLATKDLLVFRFRWGWEDAGERAIAVYKDFVNDPNFKYLPPAFQIARLTNFARLYVELNQPDEAVKILNEQVLPLNKNLIQMHQGWSDIFSDEFSVPYYILSLAYLKEGKRDLAFNSYKRWKVINASICERVGEDYCFSLPPIEELEKEISKER